jgi:hypothetical protein
MRNSSLLAIISLVFVIGNSLPAIAEDGAESTAENPASPATLKGHVVNIDDTLNQLRDARLSISRVRKATANLYDEVTRQQVSMSFNPNVVGTTVIMTPAPTFDGQLLPARKKWVVASMSEIGPIINLFKEDVDAAIQSDSRTRVGAAARKALDPLREKAFVSVKTSFDLYQQLVGLTAGATYDNGAIASVTKSLDVQIKQLDKDFKAAIGILQKEAKAAKRA